MLDHNQTEAVSFFRGACLCLAGPGAGKTTVLVSRIAHLIREYQVAPEEILVITFTKDAANEMKQRFLALTEGRGGPVNFGTFHSVFYGILRQELPFEADCLLSEGQKQKILKQLLARLSIRLPEENGEEEILKDYSRFKNQMSPLEEFHSNTLSQADFARVCSAFDSYKSKNKKIDFDDMLTETHRLFRENPRILAKWQKRFSFFLIDEMQDMNTLQFEIMQMLAESGNVFAVGDDDQSIYGFRGADPGIMMRFPTVYPDCRIIRLSVNYRCDFDIVERAKKVIAFNQNRFEKEITAFSKAPGKIIYASYGDQREEAKGVAGSISRFLRENREQKKSLAVLFRNRSQAGFLLMELKRLGISSRMKEKAVSPFDHWIIRDLESYLKVSEGSRDPKDFLAVCNHPARFVSREAFEGEFRGFPTLLDYYRGSSMEEELALLQESLEGLKRLSSFGAVNYILHGLGYEKYILDRAKNENRPVEEDLERIGGFLEFAGNYRNRSLLFAAMEEARESVREANAMQGSGTCENDRDPEVFFYTYHGSKGLEFDRVYLIDVNEGITPSKKAKKEADLEEERRMFYVAMTRAKHELYFSSVKKRNQEILYPSRYFREMEWEEG